jgi:hypothetical protein
MLVEPVEMKSMVRTPDRRRGQASKFQSEADVETSGGFSYRAAMNHAASRQHVARACETLCDARF